MAILRANRPLARSWRAGSGAMRDRLQRHLDQRARGGAGGGGHLEVALRHGDAALLHQGELDGSGAAGALGCAQLV